MMLMQRWKPPNGLPISRAPARATVIDRETNFQKTPDLDRPSRGVGCMGGLGGGSSVRRRAKVPTSGCVDRQRLR